MCERGTDREVGMPRERDRQKESETLFKPVQKLTL